MHDLAIADHHVARIADEGDGAIDPLAPRLLHQLLDVDLTQLVATGQHPHAVDRGTAIDLSHKVESMDILIEVVAFPVSRAVLMP